jgi:hypothetical protein
MAMVVGYYLFLVSITGYHVKGTQLVVLNIFQGRTKLFREGFMFFT